MFGDLMALVEAGRSVAVRPTAVRGEVSRPALARHVRAVADDIAASLAGGGAADIDGTNRASNGVRHLASVWVGTRDPYLTVVAMLASLRNGHAVMVDPEAPGRLHDVLASVCPPTLVLSDDTTAPVAQWAHSGGHAIRLVAAAEPAPGLLAPGEPTGPAGSLLKFFTSGTTGTPTCVGLSTTALLAAVGGVGRRLGLAPSDTSLCVAPLNHVQGMITGVLAALCSGGSVGFADPRHPRDFQATLPALAATWCAGSPGAHQMVYQRLSGSGRRWAGLRFLRTSSAPMNPALQARLEDFYGVAMLSAYAMTEAPGEIASMAPDRDQRPATVGKPTLCEVEVRADGRRARAGERGEIWIRGPNVVSAGPAGAWFGTNDLGSLDSDGFLRLHGRINDIINHSGLKIWPPDVEAVAMVDAAVEAAVAFPIPHEVLGEMVGLAVVPRAGAEVDRAALRRRLMADLPRYSWPSTIVVCPEIPLSSRGKIQRRALWRLLPGLSTGPAGLVSSAALGPRLRDA